MVGTGGRSTARRQTAAALFSLCLLAAGAALALTAQPFPIKPPFHVSWWLFIPVYALLQHYPVDFESRRGSHSISFMQLPLALATVLIAPGAHLLARLLGSFIDSIVIRRQPPVKASFNLAAGAVDVGIATATVGLLHRQTHPGPGLWVALLAALVLIELVGAVSIRVVWRLIGLPFTVREAVAPVLFALAVGALFTGFAIVTLAALYTDPASILIMIALGGGLALAYRAHRRLFAQQRKTEQLYEFVKDLGPVDVASSDLPALLDEVRLLLHARHLDLAVPQPGGGWLHASSAEEGEDAAPACPDDDLVEKVARRGAPEITGTTRGRADTMSTPLVGAQSLVGILTVTDRLGEVRDFDMGDLRLLETVATELATALERGRLLADLNRAATTDSLTGLPNLAEVTRLITDELSCGDVLLAAVAVDSFREVNDALGHQIGDALLREVSTRLLRACPGALVGRIGGGRFAVALSAASAGHDPEMFGLGIRAQVEGTAQVGAVGTHIRLSVGVVRAPDHGTEAATLLRRAETAMHGAREVHGGPVVWEPAYEVLGQRRLAVVTALREALATGAIGLAFQPKIEAATGAASGVEALARWTHPALGAIGPDEFIPLAEASGLMGSLTSSVLRQALVACKGWQRRARDVGVAVNVSADTVLDPSFVTQVAAVLTAIDIDPSLLTLELTEGVVVADPALAAVRLGELRALGVKISVDDFGTGYSSLTYLKGLPVDEVKIDKGFVDQLVEDAADRAVVRGVVDIAHTLGLRVVAEGVENPEQHDLLRTLGVDEVQGYLHARPMAALDVAAWLRTRDRTARV